MAAQNNIPRTKEVKNKPPVPWFDREVKEAMKRRKRSQRKLNRGGNIVTEIIDYQRSKAMVWCMVKEKSRDSLEAYLSTINHNSNTGEV